MNRDATMFIFDDHNLVSFIFDDQNLVSFIFDDHKGTITPCIVVSRVANGDLEDSTTEERIEKSAKIAQSHNF